jgi:hypothetical protein
MMIIATIVKMKLMMKRIILVQIVVNMKLDAMEGFAAVVKRRNTDGETIFNQINILFLTLN